MAFTLGFHIILACFGVGFPVLMLMAEVTNVGAGDRVWSTIAYRWAKPFAIGAVSGTVLSFELGLLWPMLTGTAMGSTVLIPNL